MSRKTPRELERELEELKRQRGETDAPTDVTVEWHVSADPDPGADTIDYDPETTTLTYQLWEAQERCREALKSGDYDIVALLGGYGSGKSVLGARWLLATALAHPGTQVLAMGQAYSKGREATYRTLFEQLPGDNTRTDPERSPLVNTYLKSDHRLLLTNDTVIVLGSADSWNRYAGAEFGAIWLDEPSHYETDLHDLLEMLGGRLRGVAGPKTQCWTLTGNGYNDAWEILEQRRDKTGDPLGLEIELVRASTLENPYLAAAERDRYERQYGGTDRAAQALHGGFAAAQGLVYAAFSRETHVIPHDEALERVESEWRVYGYDAGWNHPRVLLELGKTSYDQLVVLDAFYESESHIEDVIAWLDRHDKPQGTIYGEHEPADLEKFHRAGYPAKQATKALEPGIAEVRKRLQSDGNRPVKPQSGPKSTVIRRSGRDTSGRRRIKRASSAGAPTATASDRDGRVGLLVSDRCEPLIQEFLGYKEEHVRKAGAQDHALDALRYACMGVASE